MYQPACDGESQSHAFRFFIRRQAEEVIEWADEASERVEEDASTPSSEPHGSEIKRLQAHIKEQEAHRGGF